jgi:hypothetical protein
VWQPSVVCSRLEQEVIKRIKRAKLFVWLREHRHELFDEDFQAELAAAYQESPKGQPPVPPAQLGLATILQGAVASAVSVPGAADSRHENLPPPTRSHRTVGVRRLLLPT